MVPTRNINLCLSAIVLLALNWPAVALADQRTVGSHTWADAAAMLQHILEPLANRKLTAVELQDVTAEFKALIGAPDCNRRCSELIEINRKVISPVIQNRGSPADFRVRHYYNAVHYFSPVQSGGPIQKIITGSDPILVVKKATKQLMTRADVIGALNLKKFADGHSAPTSVTLLQQQVVDGASKLNQLFSKSNGTNLPDRLRLAASYWAGVQQSWPDLTDQERQKVRRFFSGKRNEPPLSPSLYARLLGFTNQEARQYSLNQELAYFRAQNDQLMKARMNHLAGQLRIWAYFGYPGY